MNQMENIRKAARLLAGKHAILVFTGAGISVESGIPPFRGQGGLWNSVDPQFIEIDWFEHHPRESWAKIKDLFYDKWGQAKPNPAHTVIADMQKHGLIHSIVTQNIDCLHQAAGATDVVEFHGTLDRLDCTRCSFSSKPSTELLKPELPLCPKCRSLLKPGFVFYGEGIPEDAVTHAFNAARECDAVLISGTGGEVQPACMVPREARRRNVPVVELNLTESAFTANLTDVFLQGKAGLLFPLLWKEMLQCL